MQSKRIFHRAETSVKARIVSDGLRVVDCVIKDLSEAGAKIEVDNALTLPADFDLEMIKTGESFRAEIRWRYAHLVGIRFVYPDTYAPGEPTRDDLIMENVKLRDALGTLAQRLTQLGERVYLPTDLMKAPRLSKDAGPTLI